MSTRRTLANRLKEMKERRDELWENWHVLHHQYNDEICKDIRDTAILAMCNMKLSKLEDVIQDETARIHELEDKLAGLNQSAGHFSLSTVLALVALCFAIWSWGVAQGSSSQYDELEGRIQSLEDSR